VLEGTVLDVAVDVRIGSPTFGKHVAVELDSRSYRQLWIPRGFAHGFLVRSEEAVFLYKCDGPYSRESELSTGGMTRRSAAGATSWHAFAMAIVGGLKERGGQLAVRTVTPIPSSQYPTAKRPRDSRLSVALAASAFGFAAEHWRAGLDYELDRAAI
jgi:hypothetical protein